LYHYSGFTSSDVDTNFVPGTFGYQEGYNSLSQSRPFHVNYLQDDTSVYVGTPYLFVSAGSGGGIRIYVFKLDYSNLWSTLCCECILKSYC